MSAPPTSWTYPSARSCGAKIVYLSEKSKWGMGDRTFAMLATGRLRLEGVHFSHYPPESLLGRINKGGLNRSIYMVEISLFSFVVCY